MTHYSKHTHSFTWQRYTFVFVLEQRSGPIICYQGINAACDYSYLCSFRHDVRKIVEFLCVLPGWFEKVFHRDFFVS